MGGFALPQLSRSEQLALLTEQIKIHALEAVILDPLYLGLLAGNPNVNAGNMYDMGPLLAAVSRLCLDAGATPILCHHNIKRPPDPFAVPELEDLAFAGVAEFARQWVLGGRREKFVPGTGEHKLWMNIGGSAGFSSCWSLDIDEGVMNDDFTGRKWEVSVTRATDAINNRKDQAEKKREEKAQARDRAEAQVLNAIDLLARKGEQTTRTQVRANKKLSGERFNKAVARLLAEGVIVTEAVEVTIGSGAKRTVEALKRSSVGRQ